MSSEFRLSVFVQWYSHDKYMEIVVSPECEGWEGPVVRTIRKDNVSVGIDGRGKPVYIRVKGAQDLDRTFRAAGKRMDKREQLTSLQLKHMLDKIHDLLRDARKSDAKPLPEFRRECISKLDFEFAK